MKQRGQPTKRRPTQSKAPPLMTPSPSPATVGDTDAPESSDCPNCAAAMGQQRAIRYTLDVENPDGSAGVLRFKVLKARWMVAADPRVPKMIAARALRAWIEERPEAINAGHLEHIPALVREHPGLLVQFDEMAPDGSMRPTAVLIDGTHRAALALRDGRPFYAYLLSDAEMAAIVEVEGTEYASVPGTSPDLSETPIGRVIP